MEIEFSCNTSIDISSSKLEEIYKQFGIVLKRVIDEFFTQILLTFADHYMEQ